MKKICATSTCLVLAAISLTFPSVLYAAPKAAAPHIPRKNVRVIIDGTPYVCIPEQNGGQPGDWCDFTTRAAVQQFDACVDAYPSDAMNCFEEVFSRTNRPIGCLQWQRTCYDVCKKAMPSFGSDCYDECYK
jgi:hypothetical protein